jgi:hypothetical protein
MLGCMCNVPATLSLLFRINIDLVAELASFKFEIEVFSGFDYWGFMAYLDYIGSFT